MHKKTQVVYRGFWLEPFLNSQSAEGQKAVVDKTMAALESGVMKPDIGGLGRRVGFGGCARGKVESGREERGSNQSASQTNQTNQITPTKPIQPNASKQARSSRWPTTRRRFRRA
jgi:hypothetical protein